MASVKRKAGVSLTPCASAVALALGALAAQGAWAQTIDPNQKVEKIVITGSSIKRVEGETALPVQVVTREEIERSGSTTVAELMTQISANAAALTDGASFSDISGQRGFNGANLRGVGVSSTLILLNGRRMANFASPGGASGVDLNAIPMAAIQRVEVLKDGASAIYGTDAIGGVINFITRDDYRGADVSAYTSRSQHGGAGKNIFTVSGGFGSLSEDRFNVFAVLDYQDTDTLRSRQRDWIGSSYQPDINLDVASSNSYPANYRRLNGSGRPTGPRINPSAPACNPPATVYAPGSFVGSLACMYDYMQDTEIFPESKRLSFLTRGQFAINSDHTLFAEYSYSDTETTYKISPQTVTDLNYPAGGIFYPTASATANGITGPLRVSMRLTEAGGRTNKVDSEAQRIIVGSKGTLGGWDYDTALNYSTNKVVDTYINGYLNATLFTSAFATGQINPFGPSGTAGLTLLDAAKISDRARNSEGKTMSFDVKASRPIFKMAGGEAAIAVGFEARRETMDFTPSELLRTGGIYKEGAASAFGGGRNVTAVYSELSLPIVKTVEAQLALRHDRYSDVGSTTNPKVGVRWTPMKELLFRSAYGTGFRAPSMADMYSPTFVGQTNGIYNDPLGCFGANANDPDYCGIQPDKLKGGNPHLKPEESKQFSIGTVFEPVRNFSGSVDFWRIEKTNVIAAPEGIYFDNPTAYASYITRDASPGPNGVPGYITQIDSRLRNLGGLKTSGLDVGFDVKVPVESVGRFGVNMTGSYVFDYKVQEGPGAPFKNVVGKFAYDQVVQRWRHTLAFNYDAGPLSTTLTQSYYSSHIDQNPGADGKERRVKSYELWDLTASYALNKQLRLRAGIKNLFDRNPPSSNQIYNFLAGYDPNYTDPRGRQYFAAISYSLK